MLTVQEAAAKYNMSETGIRSAIHRGRLSTVERYGRKLIKADELESYRAAAKVGRPSKKQEDAQSTANE